MPTLRNEPLTVPACCCVLTKSSGKSAAEEMKPPSEPATASASASKPAEVSAMARGFVLVVLVVRGWEVWAAARR